jgi:hypothetical protein
MKKLFILLSVVLSMTACTRESDTPDTSATASWKLGTTNYTQAFAIKQNAGPFVQYLALDRVYSSTELSNNSNATKTFNGFFLMFKTAPTASGRYKIVFKVDPTLLAADELMFSMQDRTLNKSYFSTNSTATADVQVTNGKIKVTIPNTTVQQEGVATPITTDASGTFIEP